jgi:hypothetical protein
VAATVTVRSRFSGSSQGAAGDAGAPPRVALAALRPRGRGSLRGKVVGGALIEYANTDGVAWPSLASLAARMGVTSERTVQRGLADLEGAGLIVIERSVGSVNRYRLTLPNPRLQCQGSGARTPDSSVGRPPTEPPSRLSHEPEEPGKEPVRPSVVRANAQKLVAYFVKEQEAAGVSPVPRDLTGKAALFVGRLIEDGVAEETIARAIELVVERRLDPSSLPSLVPEAQVGPGSRNRRSEHVADRLLRPSRGGTP